MATILDGKALAAEVRAEVAVGVKDFQGRRGRSPGLAVVLVGEDPASQIYVRNKDRAAQAAGIAAQTLRLPADISEAALLEQVAALNADPEVDGILVQLPLPPPLDSARVIAALDPDKDVDGLHPVSQGRLLAGQRGLRPCTPLGCLRLLDHAGVQLRGVRAAVVGRSVLVGKPLALLLLERHATVTLCHSRTADLAAEVARSDVVVAAVGRARLIQGDWIKQGAVVIDVGMNRLDDGKLAGDVDFAAALQRAGAITPVPGGVGPMTIAYLLHNTLEAARARFGVSP